MTNNDIVVLGNDFVPKDVDLELRARALRDYQSHVPNSVIKDLKTRYAEIVFRTIANTAYWTFTVGEMKLAIEGPEGEFPENGELKMSILSLASEIYNSTSFKSLTKEQLSRKEFLSTLFPSKSEISQNSNENGSEGEVDLAALFCSYQLRTQIKSLQGDFVRSEKQQGLGSVLAVAIEDEDGYEPWTLPGFVAVSANDEIIQQRMKVLIGIRRVLSQSVSQFEIPSETTEFGTPRISFIKLANEVHRINNTIYPAEVGTVLQFLQQKFQIADKRSLLRRLVSDFHTYIGSGQGEGIDDESSDMMTREFRALDTYLFSSDESTAVSE